MEKKNYSERVHEIKNEVLDEIRELLGTDRRHKFTNPFHIHYVEGEVATTELCLAVEVWSDGMVVFCTGLDKDTTKAAEGVTEGDAVFYYEPNSFFDILDNLKKEIRMDKLNTLRELVKKAGGSISFDGDFKFDSYNSKPLDDGSKDNKVYSGTELFGLSIQDDGHLDVNNYWEGENHDTEEGIPTYELDNIIEYVRKQTEKSPKKLLALTDEQKAAVAEFEESFKKLREMNVGIIMDDDRRLSVVNMEHVNEFETSYYIDENKDKDSFVKIDFERTPVCGRFLSYYLYSDETLYASFK